MAMNDLMAVLGLLIYIPGSGIFTLWMFSTLESTLGCRTPGQGMVIVAMAITWPLTLVVFLGMVIFCRKEGKDGKQGMD